MLYVFILLGGKPMVKFEITDVYITFVNDAHLCCFQNL